MPSGQLLMTGHLRHCSRFKNWLRRRKIPSSENPVIGKTRHWKNGRRKKRCRIVRRRINGCWKNSSSEKLVVGTVLSNSTRRRNGVSGKSVVGKNVEKPSLRPKLGVHSSCIACVLGLKISRMSLLHSGPVIRPPDNETSKNSLALFRPDLFSGLLCGPVIRSKMLAG